MCVKTVFLDEDNSVKLGDFGLSKMIKSHDFASTYVGTPFYMSPEICAAEKYTLKSDIWSLGCIIYELCSRDPPFNAKTHFQLVQKIKEGKVAPLPDMYSTELNQVIKDCLRVNPDRRPDTIQLLNMPAVKLMRKEKEVVDLNKSLRAREESLKKKEREISDRLMGMDREKVMMRDDIESSLRREWEVKARLEIDRLVQSEIEKLNKHFEIEVRNRVDQEIQRRGASTPTEQPKAAESGPSAAADPVTTDYPHSSIGATSVEDFPSTTDITEYSSIDSPEPPKDKEPKKTARTPFGRAQTMFAGNMGTPMDIEMASPSPMAIASLSLSPRRNGATKAPHLPDGNIFSANNGTADPKWTIPGSPTLEESDEEDIIPSPTRQIKSNRNPFTSKTRPVLTSQKTAPVNRLKPQTSSSGLVSKLGLAPPGSDGPRSPNRRLSKIPSAANMAGENNTAGVLSHKPSFNKKDKEKDTEALGKVSAKNNLKGRTLVELQQARAGGRPMSAMMGPSGGPENNSSGGSNTSPKRRVAGERRASGGNSEPAAIWDPERDEMPSPFLVRHRRMAKA